MKNTLLKSQSNNKLSDFVFVIITIAILLLLGGKVVSSTADDISYYENRQLAGLPELSGETLLSGDYFNELESYLADHMPYKVTLQKIDAFLRMNLLLQPVVNDIVVQDDILLPFEGFQLKTDEKIESDIRQAADIQKRFSEIVTENGGVYCYIAIPNQACLFRDKYPSYMQEKSKETERVKDLFLEALSESGVRYLDMKDVFSGENRDKIGSCIDHHCSLFGSYEIYRSLVDDLKGDYDLAFPDENVISFSEITNPYLGSRSRKLLGLWKNDEHLLKATWNCDISYRVFFNAHTNPVIGSLLSLPDNDEEEVAYTVYMNGDQTDLMIETNRPALPSILILGDSFTNGLETMIWYSFDTVYSTDLRYTGALDPVELVKTYHPEVVVCLRDYSVLTSVDGNGDLFRFQENGSTK